MEQFKGPYTYNEKIVEDWDSNVTGVYYIGVKTPDNQLRIFYIGKAVGIGGIRKRLLEHLAERKWSDATHFGFHASGNSNVSEVEEFEKEEIKKYKPKYNTQGI